MKLKIFRHYLFTFSQPPCPPPSGYIGASDCISLYYLALVSVNFLQLNIPTLELLEWTFTKGKVDLSYCNLRKLQYICNNIKLLSKKIILQWNPDFSNPRFLKPPDNSNQKSFPLDLLHSNTVILPPISRTLNNSKLPQTRANSWLPWEKLTLDN